jgi:carboxypeptidase C (cathepsin A)
MTLIRNPQTWTRYANIVFLEQPTGVGFSYSTKYSNPVSNDYEAAVDNLMTMKLFFEKFPERSNNPIYIASESYGGHYVPQWTLAILNDKNDNKIKNRFQGIIIGNPYTSFSSGSIARASVLWGLQVVSRPAWYGILSLFILEL